MKIKNKYRPPFFFEWLMKVFFPDEGEFTTLGDLYEQYCYIAGKSGVIRANWWYRKEVFKSVVPVFIYSILLSVNMFQNYIKIALRNYKRQKLFTVINVFGLAIGIAACMIIGLWVQNELSYDGFHSKADRIYRVEREIIREDNGGRWPISSAKYKQALIDDYPEIINAVRFWPRMFSIKDSRSDLHRQLLFAVDNSVFDIFDFELLAGSKETALLKPKTIVLTKNAAVKYFGTTDVVGKTLELEWDNKYVAFNITGVLKNISENSHIHFEMLMSFATYPEDDFQSWRSNYLYTYVLTDPGVRQKSLEEKISGFIDNHLEPEYGDLIVRDLSIHDVLKLKLFPLKNIHLNPSENWELEPGGSYESVILFSSIGILLLIIAGINFVNLSTARAKRRAKEVSLRKTFGAVGTQLKYQFLQESLLLTVLSAIIAIMLLTALIPLYNSVFNGNLSVLQLTTSGNTLIFIGIILVAGIAASLYPAFYLSKFEPADIIKGSLSNTGSKSLLRRNMVVVQFTISISLLIGMSIMFLQMRYIETKPIGFDKKNIIVFPTRNSEVSKNFESFKSALLSNSNILSVSGSGDLPGDRVFSNGDLYWGNYENHFSSIFMNCDFDFISTYNIELIAGRNFSKDFPSDTAGTIIINETALNKLGCSPGQAIGKFLSRGGGRKPLKIIGVVRDFNFQSLVYGIQPMAFFINPEYITSISVKVLPGNINDQLKFIKRVWDKSFAGEIFDYVFLDKRLERLYENEQKSQNILVAFAVMSVLVACLGLFGLAAFTAEERTREIGIRKVLGATITNIFYGLTKDYIRWILISTVIACFVSYYFMNSWLENFAYRIKLTPWPFVLSALAALIISMITVSYQSIKAAGTNPIETIRNE